MRGVTVFLKGDKTSGADFRVRGDSVEGMGTVIRLLPTLNEEETLSIKILL